MLVAQHHASAKRIMVSNHHKNTRSSFAMVIGQLHACTAHDGTHGPLMSDELLAMVRTQGNAFESEIDYQRDYAFDYFGFKMLEKSYLLRPLTRRLCNGHSTYGCEVLSDEHKWAANLSSSTVVTPG